MKQLKKLLLINWHFFNHELVEFDRINFLTGKNASGKTTMIDALQVIMLGDANGRGFFNKAANEKSARSLKGYLRGELGDDGDAGFRYLREGRFTGYIACEFYDDVRKSYFTLGIVFECYEDGSDEHRFFVLDSELPENHFIVNRVPMTYKELRTYVNKHYKKGKYDFPESDRGYQEIIKGKLGGLKNKYFDLFKKAVSFTPITDIETFITDYVCDVKNPVDISLMQDNIRQYKRMELEADLLEERVSALQKIADMFRSYSDEKQRLQMQSYLIDRAKFQVLLEEKKDLKEKIERLEKEIADYSRKKEAIIADLEKEREKRDELIAAKQRSDIYTKKEQLEKERKELSNRIHELNNDAEAIVQTLRKYADEWNEAVKGCSGIRHLLGREITDSFINEIRDVNHRSELASDHANNLLDIDKESLNTLTADQFDRIKDDLTKFKNVSTFLSHSAYKKWKEVESVLKELEKTLTDLEKGIKSYDPKLIALRDEIRKELARKHGKEIPVYILADLLDIRDMRWRNAVEAYLHTQKYYLLVEPQYFVDALKVYDRLKFDKGFYDWGLIDTGKLKNVRPRAQKGSLAEEVVTDNPYAGLFIDYVMGKVMKCDKVEELRNHDRAITDSCMLYQGYVARQLNPERWKYPFIGRKALEEQKETVKIAIEKHKKDLADCKALGDILTKATNITVINPKEYERYLKTIEEAGKLPELENRLSEVDEELKKLDFTWLYGLNEKINECENRINEYEKEKESCTASKAKAENEKETIVREKLPYTEKQEEDARMILSRYDASWVNEKGEPRFLQELDNRGSAKEIIQNFSSQLERTKNQTVKKKDDLEKARSDYNVEYKMSYDIKQEGNTSYDKELDELRSIKLPEYKNRIKDAKEKAFQQFQDDFLAKLKSNIDTVKTQINELNNALKESRWGNERYRFTCSPKPEYKKYYDMITDEMLMEGYNIASQAFRNKHSDAIDELFKQITDVDSAWMSRLV
jgi:chromosome segregation ATPase